MRYFTAIILLLLVPMSQAQNSLLVSLETSSNYLQTGQYYEINIRVDAAADLWLATLEISYDPSMVYIVGTKAGSPVQQGTLFSPDHSAIFQNQIDDALLYYSLSMLAPAEPISGDGIIGTFRIYPLSAGTSQLFFRQAEFTKALFEEQNGQRVGVGAETMQFLPILLELNISGETVEPPSEATATPLPTEIPVIATQFVPPVEATLVNVTAAARTPEALAPEPLPRRDNSFLLLLAIGLIVFGGIGTVFVFLLIKRK